MNSRRRFLQSSAALAGSLVIGFYLPRGRGFEALARARPSPPSRRTPSCASARTAPSR